MISDALAGELNSALRGRKASKRVEENEVVNRAIVADSSHVDPGLLQLPSIGLTLITERIVVSGYDECLRL